MKKVYIAHPFLGKEENYRKITDICRKLVKTGVMPVSPVHAFRFLDDHDTDERETALLLCEELVGQCDELWLFGEWWESEGCLREIRAAQYHLVPIRIVVGWEGGQPIFGDAAA